MFTDDQWIRIRKAGLDGTTALYYLTTPNGAASWVVFGCDDPAQRGDGDPDLTVLADLGWGDTEFGFVSIDQLQSVGAEVYDTFEGVGKDLDWFEDRTDLFGLAREFV